MPRKDRNVRKHGKAPPTNFNKNKPKGQKSSSTARAREQDKTSTTREKKVSLRTSLDVYNRLLWDADSLSIDLNQVCIGYIDGKYDDIQEIYFTEFRLIKHGGDIPMHKLVYFRYQDTLLWDHSTRLDRIFGSGHTLPSQTWSALNSPNTSNAANTSNTANAANASDPSSGPSTGLNSDQIESKSDATESDVQVTGSDLMQDAQLPDTDSFELEYLIVLDFEATCDGVIESQQSQQSQESKESEQKSRDLGRKWSPIEIIEWPAMIVDVRNKRVLLNKESTFHYYIRPRVHPELTAFCTDLTGITQDMVDNCHGSGKAFDISEVYYEWMQWCDLNKLTINNARIVTCGDWDLRQCWIAQRKVCKWPIRENVALNCIQLQRILKVMSVSDTSDASGACGVAADAADAAEEKKEEASVWIDESRNGALLMNLRWVNIKKVFLETVGTKAGGMMGMLEQLNIKHVGRHHSGIDDVRNICSIAIKLIEMGANFGDISVATQWPFEQTGNYKKKKIGTNYNINSKQLHGKHAKYAKYEKNETYVKDEKRKVAHIEEKSGMVMSVDEAKCQDSVAGVPRQEFQASKTLDLIDALLRDIDNGSLLI